jgi:hypothetical protein
MFGNRAHSDASTEGKAPKRRREGRGLGPFSGGQLTIIIVTLAVVMGFPFAAFAVTGSNVFVTDATSGTHAKVDAKNNLQTAIHDPVSSTAATVDTSGNLHVSTGRVQIIGAGAFGTVPVAGGVTATQTPPNAMYVQFLLAGVNTTTCDQITPPSGKALVITKLDISPSGGTTSTSEAFLTTFTATASSCNGTNTTVAKENYSTDLPHTVDFGAGIAIANGHFLDFGDTGPSAVYVTAYGYTVPSSSCSTGCL